jgi:hypothetical protein
METPLATPHTAEDRADGPTKSPESAFTTNDQKRGNAMTGRTAKADLKCLNIKFAKTPITTEGTTYLYTDA